MFLIIWDTMLIYNMLKQLFIIFSIIGLSYAQIQQGGSPEYYDTRINDINFIEIDHTNLIEYPFNSSKRYDAIILTVAHDEFYNYTINDFNNISRENLVLLDIKGIYKFSTWKL